MHIIKKKATKVQNQISATSHVAFSNADHEISYDMKRLLTRVKKFVVRNGSDLVINYFQLKHEGNYSCIRDILSYKLVKLP